MTDKPNPMRSAESAEELVDLITSTPCPRCGNCTLELIVRLEATQGLVSGTGLKVAARDWPWIVCSSCEFEERASA